MNYLNIIDKDISLLLDNLPVGIIRFNHENNCIYANKSIIDLFDLHLQNDNLKNKDIRNIYINSIHLDDRENERNVCTKFLNDYIECESTVRIFNTRLNQYRWMTNKRTLIRNDDSSNGNPISYMYTLQDIHENKLLELNLRNESIRAEQAYNHKSIFLANMSHEIRTPLNGIIGMLTLLEDTKLTNDQQDYIYMIKECSFNLMTIINDILDYSKLEVGKISLDTRPMNLLECIESTNDIVLSKIYEKSLEYNYTINPHIPEYIYGDSNRLKQVILNLLSNSIKFTDKGNIFLNINIVTENDYVLLYKMYKNRYEPQPHETTNINHLKIQDDPQNTNDKIYLRFDITDTGCGIDDSQRNKLFKSFSQVDNRITSKIYQGTGLGLAISKELVELMGGIIWLDWSQNNNGSRFSFIIQTKKCEKLILNEHLKISDNVLQNANVLILDDNLHNRISLTGMVTKWGMRAYAFSNGEEALHFTRLTQFDIGLIDICMPKLDGPGFANKLREQKEFNNSTFPLVALSSLGDKAVTSSKYFKTHLIKPIKESKLKKVCIDLLQKRNNQNGHNIESKSELHQNQDSNSKSNNTRLNLDKYISQNDLSELKENVRILLAEDVYINQKVVSSFLTKLGFSNICIVENGQQCLEMATSKEFDIILLDIRMPIMNGEIVLEELLKYYDIHKKGKPYIVAVTAYCLREDKEKYLNMGFDDYIPKPITVNDLKRCLNTYIETLLQN
jgi:signal transduction histidine kinase/DNA-binding response OmpR family regulator